MFGRGSRALSSERDEMVVFARPAPFYELGSVGIQREFMIAAAMLIMAAKL
jgi:hypothetical protein